MRGGKIQKNGRELKKKMIRNINKDIEKQQNKMTGLSNKGTREEQQKEDRWVG